MRAIVSSLQQHAGWPYSAVTLEQAHQFLETFQLGRLQPARTAVARLREHRLELAEGVEAPFAMVGAHATGSHASKGLGLLRQVVQAVVDGDATGDGLLQHLARDRS